MYRLSSAQKSTAKSIVGDILRAWDSRDSDEAGSVSVARAIDVIFVKEHTHRQLIPISKAFTQCGLTCTEVKDRSGVDSAFQFSRMSSSVAFRLLVAFWEANVCAKSFAGFEGRYYHLENTGKRAMFSDVFVDANVEAMDVHDVTAYVEILSSGDDMIFPSISSGRRCLKYLLCTSENAPVPSQDPQSAARIRAVPDACKRLLVRPRLLCLQVGKKRSPPSLKRLGTVKPPVSPRPS